MMNKKLIIEKLHFDEVIVPCHAGAINSDSLAKPLHKLPVNGSPAWSVQFDTLPKLFLTLTLSDGSVGYGEFYRDHNWTTVKHMSELLLGNNIHELILQNLPLARCREYDGFECAIWDAFAKTKGLRIVDLIGGALRDKVKISAWSSHRTIDEIGPIAKKYQDMGYDTLKLKCDVSDPVLEWCQEIKRFANGMYVILDANERWINPFYARKIVHDLEKVGNVFLIEDPIPHWMMDEYKQLRQSSSIPIIMHISIPYAQEGQRVNDSISAIKHGAIDGFNFNAGIHTFMQLDAVASTAGLHCWHGSEIDLGILEALYVHTAAAAKSCIWPSDIFGSLLRQNTLLKLPLHIDPPYAYLPENPGLGVEIDPNIIDKFKISEKTFVLGVK